MERGREGGGRREEKEGEIINEEERGERTVERREGRERRK